MHCRKGKYYIKIIKSQQMILHAVLLLVEEDKEGANMNAAVSRAHNKRSASA